MFDCTGNNFFVCKHCTAKLLFVEMIAYGFVTDDLTLSTIMPIPKGKNTNPTDLSAGNYTGIALGSLLGNVFDMLLSV